MEDDYQKCTDACKVCHDLCNREVARLIESTQPSSLGDVEIEALIKCAAMCETAGKALDGRRSLAEIICVACATNCEQTAALLASHPQMADCVRAARECAAVAGQS
ncbi:hypothetical protein ACHMW6_06835 [Pseudoduganella sp. UC29_106]|uniref:hypothetical protein n=1 Tax=Pseudoduganella sp. UC29_106 TaxID=3374553 RepID=UPI003758288A